MVDLKSYFDNWTSVQVDTKLMPQYHEWCTHNIGIYGCKWCIEQKLVDIPKRGILSKVNTFISFAETNDATLFIIAWGGSVV